MPKRLAVVIILTFIPIVTTISNYFKKNKWSDIKKDIGAISFGVLWLCIFARFLYGLCLFIKNMI